MTRQVLPRPDVRITASEVATNQDPEDLWMRLRVAEVYTMMGKHDEAIREYESVKPEVAEGTGSDTCTRCQAELSRRDV